MLARSVEEHAVDGGEMAERLPEKAGFAVEGCGDGESSGERSRALSSIQDVHNVVRVVAVDDFEQRSAVDPRAVLAQRPRPCHPLVGPQQALSAGSGE